MSEIDRILEDRGSRYGDFGVQSQTAQAIREAFQKSQNWDYLPPYMREGLDLVATKISRMLCGDPMYMDNVVDILGYMTLVKTEMEKEHARIEAFAKRAGVKKDPVYAERPPKNPYKPDVGAVGSPLGWNGPYNHSQSD